MTDARAVSERIVDRMDVVERGKGRKKKKGVVTNIVIFEGETAINYDEPVRRWLCCYLFHRRGQRSERNALETIVHEEAETAGDPAFRAKAHKFAQMLYYQDDVAAERQKLEADRKALEVERQIIPMKFRMYNWGKPAPLAFTERVLRQESRIGLCTTFDKCIKGYAAKYMR